MVLDSNELLLPAQRLVRLGCPTSDPGRCHFRCNEPLLADFAERRSTDADHSAFVVRSSAAAAVEKSFGPFCFLEDLLHPLEEISLRFHQSFWNCFWWSWSRRYLQSWQERGQAVALQDLPCSLVTPLHIMPMLHESVSLTTFFRRMMLRDRAMQSQKNTRRKAGRRPWTLQKCLHR